MYSNDPGHDKRWRADAIPWSEHNTEAFAGLHNERKRIIVVFDEASNIADLVWEVAEEIGRHTSELQSLTNLVCRLLLEKKKKKKKK